MAQRNDVVARSNHAREQDCGFVRLRARAGKKALLQFSRRDLSQFFREGDDVLVRKESVSVLELVPLRLNLRSDFRVAVPDSDGDDAAEEIQVLIPRDVP